MKYDDASWHSGGKFPSTSPPEFGGTHIALFLKWCFANGWASDLHLREEPKETQQVIDGVLSATEFLFTVCDGKFSDRDLNDEGNAFASRYYGDDGLFPADYEAHFGELMYLASEADHDYSKFAEMVDQRRASGILTQSQEAG